MNMPNDIEIVFEDYCLGCSNSDPVIIPRKVDFEDESLINHRISCNNIAICQKVRSMAAKEEVKEPFK